MTLWYLLSFSFSSPFWPLSSKLEIPLIMKKNVHEPLSQYCLFYDLDTNMCRLMTTSWMWVYIRKGLTRLGWVDSGWVF